MGEWGKALREGEMRGRGGSEKEMAVITGPEHSNSSSCSWSSLGVHAKVPELELTSYRQFLRLLI